MPKLIRSAAVLLLCAGGLSVAGDAAADPREITLEAAVAEAMARSPEIEAAEAAVGEARARLLGAGVYPYNPTLEGEAADRSGPEGSSTDRGLALSQVVEVGGQRGRRLAAARAGLAAAEARLERRRREVSAAVARAFVESLHGAALRRVAEADLELTRELVRFEERRLEAGAGTAIALNLARAADGRAARRLQEGTAAWLEARARLADEAGLDPLAPPMAAGSLPETAGAAPPAAELAGRAVETRADLAAARAAVEHARRRIALERAAAVPDVELGAFAAREEGDDLLGVRAGVALPLFDRNQGAIAEAEAASGGAAAELADAELRVRREVAETHARYRTAALGLDALRELVLGTLEESLSLLRRAVDAGKMSATDVLLLRRELVDGRREAVDAAAETWLAWIDLELAAGAELAGGPAAAGSDGAAAAGSDGAAQPAETEEIPR